MSRFMRCIQFLEECGNMRQLKQAHAYIIMGGFGKDNYAVSRLMAFCSDPKKGCVEHACILFEQIAHPTICVRNTMIKALLLWGKYVDVVNIYCQILRDGIFPDNYTLPYMLKACASLENSQIGEEVHDHALKLGFDLDIFVGNTLILMYSACGNIKAAKDVFDSIPRRTAASWTLLISAYSKQGKVEAARALFDEIQMKDMGTWGCMISSYVQNNCLKEALVTFRQMQLAGIEPDEGVLVSVLSACAQLGALDIGTWIHFYLKQARFPLSVQLSTALLDMYLKCGDRSIAIKLFASMPEKDVVSWNVMILGLAMHGDGLGALQLFDQMESGGFYPDGTTFIAVFSACYHAGLVEEGLRQFDRMRVVYKIEPKSDHYGCIVGLLAQVGLLKEVQEVINQMPSLSSPSEKAVAWRMLLNACWRRGDIQMAEVAAKHIFHMEAHSGAYVLLSNMYEKSGEHEYGRRVKMLMKERGVLKFPGCSSIEVEGSIHEFIAGERTHLQMEEIYEVLERINGNLERLPCIAGYWD